MQRDMNLIRAILLTIEASPTANAPNPFEVPGYSAGQIGYHSHLMAQAGLIDAADASSFDSDGPTAFPLSLTSAGHDFLDAARDDTVWQKALANVKAVGGGVTFGVLKDLLVWEIKSRLHLPQ